MINFPSLGAPRRATVLFQPFQTHETRTAENRQRGLGDGGARRYHPGDDERPCGIGLLGQTGPAHRAPSGPSVTRDARQFARFDADTSRRAWRITVRRPWGLLGPARIGFWPPRTISARSRSA